MSETQQTTDNEEQPLDLDAIEGRAADLSLALAIQTVQRQVLARDVRALVARVRELEAELVAVKADNENLLHERLHATEASHELAATCDTLRAAMRSALGDLAHGHAWSPYSTQYVTDAMKTLRAALGEGREAGE